MVNPTLERELHQHLQALKPAAQQKVLEFAEALVITRPRGVPGQELLRFAGTMSDEDAKEMMEAVDEECGKVDGDGW